MHRNPPEIRHRGCKACKSPILAPLHHETKGLIDIHALRRNALLLGPKMDGCNRKTNILPPRSRMVHQGRRRRNSFQMRYLHLLTLHNPPRRHHPPATLLGSVRNGPRGTARVSICFGPRGSRNYSGGGSEEIDVRRVNGDV